MKQTLIGFLEQMNIRTASILIPLLLLPHFLSAQPLPCEDPPVMTSFCADACIICDIDGFTGRHEANIVGESPAQFAGECTLTAHNMQWIAFIAGSENLKVNMAVSNCQSNLGLEFGLYKGNNCENYVRISNCFGGFSSIGPGESGTIENIEPLVIGQYYYLVMDGGLGDNCDWTFTVLEGTTQVSPLPSSGSIEGAFNSCPDMERIYTLDAPIGATEFKWELDGLDLRTNAAEVPITFDRAGLYTLCVTAFNACEEGPPTCESILITAIPPTNFVERICEGDNFEVADTILNTTGFYEFHILTDQACDSVVFVDLEAVPSSFTDLGTVNICEDDFLPVGGENFSQTGIHTKVLSNELGCDSTITLDLFVVVCNIQGNITSTDVICKGEASGSISFSVLNGSPPFTYEWASLGNLFTGTGTIDDLNEGISINNLPANTYLVTVNDGFGNQRILINEIVEPDAVASTFETSNYNDFGITCFEGNDGAITLTPSGGTRPYTYLWDDGPQEATRQQLAAGDYFVTITDAVGCELEISTSLSEPSPITILSSFENPSCEGLSTGKVELEAINGGVPPYTYQLTGQNITGSGSSMGLMGSESFTGLTEGTYTLVIEDANGCSVEETATLVAPIIPVIELGDNLRLELADEIDLIPEVATGISTVTWRENSGLSCFDCLSPVAFPTNHTTYFLTATSEDNCSTTDSISILVIKVRDVFVPSAFSPNQDGINDRLIVYAGPEASNIAYLKIFSRWGEQLFEQRRISPNDQDAGWDGTHAGRLLDQGVYVWVAEIDFIDGERIVYSGDVALVR